MPSNGQTFAESASCAKSLIVWKALQFCLDLIRHMSLKQKMIGLMPRRLELAARYRYNNWLGRLEREMSVINSIVSQRRRCLDIGANVGLYTYRLAHLFKQVESFEPIPRCAKIIASSELENVHLHGVALSNKCGHATLSIPITGGPEATAMASLSTRFQEAESLIVELRTLDSFGFREVDLIKIDVEGHELEVLEGGLETINREWPTVLMEVEQRHHADRNIQGIFDYVLNLGYVGSFFWNGRMNSLSSFSVEQHQQCFDPLDRKKYVNNFIFRPTGKL
jgi:FkbM family methyltransferase